MRERALGSAVLLASLLVTRPAFAGDVHVLHANGRDDAAAAQLAAALPDASVHSRATLPESTTDLAGLARSLGTDALAVVLDGRHGAVHVARASDGLVVSRDLGSDAFARSPYAVGIVAEELVRLVREAPETAVPTRAATGDATIDGAPATEEAVPPAPPSFTLTAELAAGAVFGLRGGPSVFGAHLAGGAAWLPDGWLVSAEGSLGLTAEHTLSVTAPAIGGGQLRHRRIDVALRASFGRSDRHAAVLAQASLGLALGHVELIDHDGNVRAEHDGSHPFIGLGLALRRPIGFGVSLGLSLGVDWAASPTRYLVRGAPVFEESRIRARSALSLGWSNYP